MLATGISRRFRIYEIPIYKALIESEEIEAAAQALSQGWLGMGSYVGDFEEAVEKVLGGGTRRAVALSTGYAAIHVGLLIAGAAPGDEVIVPALSHLADAQAIRAVGAEPVLCDIDPETLCLDPNRVAELVGPRTRAILALDYGPHLCDEEAIAQIAEAHGLRVVRDAAHSFGASVGDQMVGSTGDICIFSFDPVKALSCIDGGVVVAPTDEEVDRVRALRVLGASNPAQLAYGHARTWEYDVEEPGFRYHLSNIHAAVGLAQLGKLDVIRWTRQEACRRYQSRLAGIDGLRLPECDVSGRNPFLFYVRVGDGRREAFRAHLASQGVETGIHWVPIHHLSFFSDCRRGPLEVTEDVAREIVSLPLHSCMPEATVERVCDAVLSYFS